MLEQYDCRAVESRTIFVAHGFVLHWTIPVHACMKPMLRAYEVGMSTGDLESAMWGIYFYMEFAIYSGRSLKAIEADFQVYTRQMKEFKQLKALKLSLCLWQGILNLLGRSDHTCDLTGEAMTEEAVLQEAAQSKDTHTIGMVHRLKTLLAFFFGEIELGSALALDYGEDFAKQNPGCPGVVQVRLHCAVCCFAMARTSKQRRYLSYAKRLSRIIKSWVGKGNPNMIHYDSLLEAELAVVEKRSHFARKHYEAAVLLAARKGFVHDHALISERYGEFLYFQLGDRREAEYRIGEAIKLYEEWGAAAKVKQIEEKYAALWKPQTPPDEISFSIVSAATP